MKRPFCLLAVLCLIVAGCAGPARTFVSEETEEESRPAKVSRPTEPSVDSSSFTPAPPASAPNHPEPSVWTKWVGALVPSRPKPAPPIPLPRTDKEDPL